MMCLLCGRKNGTCIKIELKIKYFYEYINCTLIVCKMTQSSVLLPSCCICSSAVDLLNAFVPARCYVINGKRRAHRICPKCWWNVFALENTFHQCPGCKNGLDLLHCKEDKEIVIID